MRIVLPDYIQSAALLKRFSGNIDDLLYLARAATDSDSFIASVFVHMREAPPAIYTAEEDTPFIVLLMMLYDHIHEDIKTQVLPSQTPTVFLIVNVRDVWERIDSLVDDSRLPTIDAQALMSQAVEAVERVPNNRTTQYFIDSFIQNHSFTKDIFEEHTGLMSELCKKLTEICNILSGDLLSLGCYHKQAHELMYEYDNRLGVADIRLRPRIHYRNSVNREKTNDRFTQQRYRYG